MSHQIVCKQLKENMMKYNDKELTEQIIKQVRDERVLQLEEAVDLALTYLEAIMGSDFDESETIQHIWKLYQGEPK